MKNVQITKLEMSVLNAIQEFTAEEFTSSTGNWAYVHEIATKVDGSQLRALITTLKSKGVIEWDSNTDGVDGAFVIIQGDFFMETGNYAPSGSPEIKFINLEVKA
jgi:hypothetical protein